MLRSFVAVLLVTSAALPADAEREAALGGIERAIAALGGEAKVAGLRYAKDKMDDFRAAEKEAREAKRGLWADAKEEAKPEKDKGKEKPNQADTKATVYLTTSGKKYHAEGCRFLAKSKNPVTLEEAKKQGCGPCSVCKPLE